PLRWSHVLFAPFLPLLNGSGGWILRRLGVPGDRSHRHVHAPEEIEMLVRESREGGQIEEAQRVRLQRTLRLSRRSVRQVMVPRRRIVSIDRAAPVPELLERVTLSPYTRLVVQRGGLDEVDGYLHTKDLVRALARGRTIDQLPDLVRPLTRLASSCTLDDALAQLRNRRSRLALVVDSLGEIEGLISIEDVMRELVGALSDEFKRDTGPLAPVLIGSGIWRMPGRLALDELSEWARGEDIDPVWSGSTVETLGGWLIERVGLLPQLGQRIAVGALEFTIERLDGVAIDTVRVERFADAGETLDG
ncbi:MAG: hemolysin family protein, partial [Pseudomonadales bacterium]